MADQTNCCWKPAYSDGRPWEGEYYDGEPHFNTRADAQAAIPEGDDAVPVQLDHPCVYVTCAECETRLDEDDGDWIVHFDSREEALSFARDYGWTVQADSAWCPADECTTAARTAAEGATHRAPGWYAPPAIETHAKRPV